MILVPSEEETGTGIVREPIAQLTEKKSIRADESLLETTYSEEIIYEDEKRTGSTESLRGKASGLDISSDYQPEGTAGEAPEIALSSAAFKERMSRDKMTVKGRVIGSADGDPLPGVNVTVKGTSVGTVSDMEGNFSIEVPENAEPVLAINYIGYVSEEVDVTDSRDITLALSEDLLALDEVVVVGYGVQKKSDETGSVSTLTAEQITEQASKAPIIVEPKPNGGLREYKDHIEKNIRYDLLPPFEKTQVVRVKFTVMTSGEIINIFILKSAGKAFDDEAIRLIKEGPPWEPGTVEGVPAEDDVYLRIKFQPR